MYRFLTALILFVLVVPSMLGNPDGALAKKPVHMQEILSVIPNSLPEMFAESDDVLEVEIRSSAVRAVGRPERPYVRTFYTAKVMRTHKGSRQSQVVFTQAAGELEFPDYILRAAGEALQVGARYVVFLRRNDTFGGRMLIGERSGAFKIGKGGRIEPQGFGKIAEEQRSVSEKAFGDELDYLSQRPTSQQKNEN